MISQSTKKKNDGKDHGKQEHHAGRYGALLVFIKRRVGHTTLADLGAGLLQELERVGPWVISSVGSLEGHYTHHPAPAAQGGETAAGDLSPPCVGPGARHSPRLYSGHLDTLGRPAPKVTCAWPVDRGGMGCYPDLHATGGLGLFRRSRARAEQDTAPAPHDQDLRANATPPPMPCIS